MTVPLTLNYLGPERYGMWVTLSSMIALLGFTDLGIGNGLMNAVNRAIARGSVDEARRSISSALVILSALAISLGAIALLVGTALPWADILAARSPLAVSEAGTAVVTWLACFLVGQPLAVATQVRFARQEGYLVHLAAAAGNIAALVGLLAVISAQLGLPALVLAMAGPPLLATALNGLVLFLWNAPELRPSRRDADPGTGARLMRTGFLFFVLQVSMAVAFASDTLVVAQLIGASAVAAYGVTSRLFLIPAGIVSITLSPLWPAYGEAIARGDVEWTRGTLRRSLRLGLALVVPSAVVLIVFGSSIIRLWVGGSVQPPFLLILGFGIWIVLNTIGVAVAMLLNGAGEIRLQALAAAFMAITNLALSIWLTGRIGVAGVIWGTVITYAVFVLVPMFLYLPRVLGRLGKGMLATVGSISSPAASERQQSER